MIAKLYSKHALRFTFGAVFGFLLTISCILAVVEGGGQSIFTMTVTTTNPRGTFDNAPVQLEVSFPVILRKLGVDGKADPRSIRVQQDGCDVPFRLSDSIPLTGEGTISWRKSINGPENFTISFALEETGVDYDYPTHIPLIGNGDYFTYGRRGFVGDFVGWLAHRMDVVDWYGTGEDLILVSGHEGTHEAAASLFRFERFTLEGLPVVRQVLPVSIQGSIVVADFQENGMFDLLTFSTSHSNIIWHRNTGAPGTPEFLQSELLSAGGTVYSPGHGNAIRGVEVIDWTGDGCKDLLVGTSEASGAYGAIYLLENIGSLEQPRFAAPKILEAEGKPIKIDRGFVRPAAYPADGDGVHHLITGNRLGDVFFIRNIGEKGDPRLLPPVSVLNSDGEPMCLPYQMHYVVVHDLDGDGLKDLLIAPDEPFLLYARNTGRTMDGIPMFDDPVPFQEVDPALSPGSLAVPQFVSIFDGRGPSIVAGASPGYVQFFENQGNGLLPEFVRGKRLQVEGETVRIQAGPTGSLLGPSEANWGYTAPLATDWTHNGQPDIVLGSILTNYRVFTDVSFDPVFEARAQKYILNEYGGPFRTVHRVRPAAVDLHKKGLNGFLGLDPGGFLCYWDRLEDPFRVGPARRLQFDSGEEIKLSPPLAEGGASGRIKLAVGDWTGNGVWDIVLGTPMTHLNEYAPFRHSSVFLLENVGSNTQPRFRKPELIKTGDGSYLRFGIHSAAPALVDLDGDGHLDLVVGSENGRLYYYARSYLEGETTAEIKTVSGGPEAVSLTMAGFRPSPIGIPMKGMQLWLRADHGVHTDDGVVTKWEDQSGNSNHAIPESGLEPAFSTSGIGNLPTISFDGTRSCLIVEHDDGLNAGDGLSVFIVYRYYGGFRLVQKRDSSNGITDDAWFIMPQNGLAIGRVYRNEGGAAFPAVMPQLQSNVYDAGCNEIRIFRNGVLLTTLHEVKPQIANQDALYIGKRNYAGFTEGHLKGEIAELIIYNRSLSDTERCEVEAYLKRKYGL